MIAKEEEIIIPGQAFSIDNMGNATLAWLKSECSLFDFSTEQLDGMVTYLADQNQYNPVAEWVNSKPWDGVPRVQGLYDTVKGTHDHDARKRAFKETLIRRWCISAIAAAFSPNGISAAGVLTFQGAQYLGKTKWFKQLVPAELGLLKDGMILRPDDKDSVKQCVSFWMVELGELDATFRKSDIAALKSFLTNDRDVLRRAYARKESSYARRTVFFASVNPKEFLHDPTGNRRYWTIEATELDHSHGLDMQQVWAEFYEMWKAGEGYYLTGEEVAELNEHNEQYTAVDPVEDRVMSKLNWQASAMDWRWMTATDILMEIGMDRPTRMDVTTCAAMVRKHNGNQGRRSHGKALLYVPPIFGDVPF
jgi:putative DNA primase/helicase